MASSQRRAVVVGHSHRHRRSIVINFAANAQTVSGSFRSIANEPRVGFMVDLSVADIMGMTEEQFAEYEPDWKKDKYEILSLISSSANKETNNAPRLGNYKDANYDLKLVIRSIDVKGNYDCDIVLLKRDEVLAKGVGLYGKGGKFGTKLNLMKDGAENIGKMLGRFLNKNIR